MCGAHPCAPLPTPLLPTTSHHSPPSHTHTTPATAAAVMSRRRRPFLLLTVFLAVLAVVVDADTDPSDVAAMAAVAKSLNAGAALSWTGADPCAGWTGVYCSSARVTSIQLRGHRLPAGAVLPPEIGKLSALSRLEVQGCGISGGMPTFSGMTALQVLMLNNNSFTAVPSGAFAGATGLQAVALDDNPELAPWAVPVGLRDAAALVNFSANSANVNGAIPDFLGDGFPSLSHLALAYNTLRGGIPASFAGSSLQSLWLNNQVGTGRLSGSIAVLGQMPNLVQVWLHVNDFTGPLPDFGNLISLRELEIRDNQLTGPVPDSLIKLPSLNMVLLKNNLLQGPFPAFPKSVQTDPGVGPADNRFCSTAPGKDCDPRVNALISVLKPLGYPAKIADSWSGNEPCGGWVGISCMGENVTVINFLGMNLSGGISPDFALFKSLQRLILANNGFNGSIPPELATLPSLKELDVRNNQLTGKIPDFKNVNVRTDGNVGIGQALPPSGDDNSPGGVSPASGRDNNGGSGSKSSVPVAAIVGAVVGVVVLIVGGYLIFYYCKRRKNKFGRVQSPHATVIHPRHSGSDQDLVKITVASSSVAGVPPMNETMSHGSSGPSELHVLETPNMVISIQMLRSVTNNFSDDNILGKGGFGTVYKGELHDGTKIAVKRMEGGVVTNQGFEEFKSEVAVLSKVRHRHLVALLGYCLDGNERLLVYEYMPQGTLSRYLFNWGEENLNPLEWKKRLSIALDVARGVEYLHSLAHQSFIHRDLKPSNILLGDDLRAKVSDFGLVRLAPDGGNGHVSTKLAGTFGYLAPEYAAMGRVTTKVDVFSFGVILMELITGRKAIDDNLAEEAAYVVTWFRRMLINKDNFQKAVDSTIDLTEETLASITTVAELAGHCCAREPQQRPDMGHAVNVLSCLVDVWKPTTTNDEDNFGIDLDEPLPVALKKWQLEETDTRSMFPTDSLDNTQTSLPARPNGFAESFNSSDGR